MAKQTPAELASKARWRAKNPDYNREYYLRNAEREKARSRYHGRKARGIAEPTGELRSGPCEICARQCDSLCLDHCHATGQSRGWLCSACNLGLGKLGDDLASIERARSYLLRFEGVDKQG